MMFALGCIQSRQCNQDTCPTGISTQNPAHYKALDVKDKGQRVANYHHSIIKNLLELVAAAGLEHLHELEPSHINHRVYGTDIRNYSKLYSCVEKGCLITNTPPESWLNDWRQQIAGNVLFK